MRVLKILLLQSPVCCSSTGIRPHKLQWFIGIKWRISFRDQCLLHLWSRTQSRWGQLKDLSNFRKLESTTSNLPLKYEQYDIIVISNNQQPPTCHFSWYVPISTVGGLFMYAISGISIMVNITYSRCTLLVSKELITIVVASEGDGWSIHGVFVSGTIFSCSLYSELLKGNMTRLSFSNLND